MTSTDRVPAQSSTSAVLIRQLVSIAVVLIATKLILLALDPGPAFHFNDSGSYLATGAVGYIPPDRSFVYGYLLEPAIRIQSLVPVVLIQVLLSAASSWLVAFCLLRYFHASFAIAAICSFFCAIEPLQLSMERFIMTEPVATFLFAGLLCGSLEYSRTGSLWLLCALQVLAVFLVSIRVSFLPVALLTSFFLPVVSSRARAMWRRSPRHWALVLRPLIIAVCFSQVLLFAYRHVYGHLSHEPAAYLYRDGDFLLADVAPIVKPVDYPNPSQRDAVFGSLKFPLGDPDLRPEHRWVAGGLCDRVLSSAGGNEDQANRIAKETALHAVKRDPIGFARLAGVTFREFFSSYDLKDSLRTEMEERVPPLPPTQQFLKKVFDIDTSKTPPPTLTQQWAEALPFWSSLLVLSPFLYCAALSFVRHRWVFGHLLLAIYAFIFVFEGVAMTEFPNPRYLTTLAWLVFLMIGSLFTRNLPLAFPEN